MVVVCDLTTASVLTYPTKLCLWTRKTEYELGHEKRDTEAGRWFFLFGVTARQDYFTHFEPSQSLSGAKTGDPREKLPDHPLAELGLSHM